MRLAAAIGSVLLLLTIAPAGAETKVVTFDNLPAGTTVSNQYRDTHGVFFAGPTQSDGFLPVVRAVSPGLAHSGTQVADISFCSGCEFYTPRTVGRLTTAVGKVSMFVGYIGAPVGNAPATVRLTARDSDGVSLGTASTTVTQGQPFNQMLSVTSPNETLDIASFELKAEPANGSQSIGFDDLSLEIPEAGPPPDFTLHVDDGAARQGTSVEIPIEIDRLNGSNGNVMMNITGLPAGVTGSVIPNPVPGIADVATLRLSVAATAPATAYSQVTITGTPGAGAGVASRAVTIPVRVIRSCGGSQVEIGARPQASTPSTDYIVSSAADLDDVLRSSFTGRVIVPRDQEWELVDCDGNPLRDIPLRSNVHLIGERGALGSRPILFSNYIPEAEYRVFVAEGNDVSVEGLNFRGPLPGRDHARKEPYVAAITVPQDSDPDRKGFGHRVRIADNEFSQWTHAGVSVDGCLDPSPEGCGRLGVPLDDWDPAWPHLEPSDAETLVVEGNYFHHNARDGGGYGVVVGGAGYATIVGNVFDSNRHAVAASGRAYSGYFAHFNYVLAGGYKQGRFYNQHFDVHGTGPSHYGGSAGEKFEITNNTIRGDQTYYVIKTRPAFWLRGRPEQGAYFNNNIVVHDDLDAAVHLGETGLGIGEDHDEFNFHASGNRFNTDYSTEVAAGDFDGDGRTDVFVANGTGWFFSRSGIRPWEYLHASNKRTRDLGFADIDNDGITDVLYRDPTGKVGFLKSGRAELAPLTSSPVPMKDLRFGDFDGDDLTDIFYTKGDQWQIWHGSTRAWAPAASSSTSISEMLFGEFDEVAGFDVAAVRNGAWSYSSGANSSWAKLNKKLVSSFKNAVAADFDGNGTSDIGFIEGDKWQYSPDGSAPLVVMRKGPAALKPMLVGHFDPVDGQASRVQVASWERETRSRLVVWRGVGTGNGFKVLSTQAMR
jgi:hypothetical protein